MLHDNRLSSVTPDGPCVSKPGLQAFSWMIYHISCSDSVRILCSTEPGLLRGGVWGGGSVLSRSVVHPYRGSLMEELSHSTLNLICTAPFCVVVQTPHLQLLCYMSCTSILLHTQSGLSPTDHQVSIIGKAQCRPMPLPALGTQKIIQGNGTNVGTVISLQCPAQHKLVGRELTCVMDVNSTHWDGVNYCTRK